MFGYFAQLLAPINVNEFSEEKYMKLLLHAIFPDIMPRSSMMHDLKTALK